MKKISFISVVLTCLFTSLFADEDETDIASSETQKTIVDPVVKTIVLVKKSDQFKIENYKNRHGLYIKGIDIPGSIGSLKSALLPYVGVARLTEAEIQKIKFTIIKYYHAHGKPVVLVDVPSQDVTEGIIYFTISEGKVGRITIEGNKWFPTDSLMKKIRLKSGDYIDSHVLSSDLSWINRNPFRTAQAVFTPGRKVGTTDIEIYVQDRFPVRVYGGIENRGNDFTGNNRPFTGMNIGRLFWTDQMLSYQFTSSSNIHRFYSHTAQYTLPLYWRNILTVYGGYSHSSSDFTLSEEEPVFSSSGYGWQVSFRYDIPLKPHNKFLHEVMFGFDFKRTNNSLDFGGIPVTGEPCNITQFMLGYNLGYTMQGLKTSFEIEGFFSPGKWVGDQSNKRYQSLRPGARAVYAYFRTSFSLIFDLWQDMSMQHFLRGQYATQNLLPSEEYGLGGYDTVRGYKEREVNMDNIFLYNIEFYSPSMSFHQFSTGTNNPLDKLQFLVFFDVGWGKIHDEVVGENKEETLMSIGPGVRYTIGPYLIVKADYGFQLKDLGKASLGGPSHRLHFSALIGF